MKDKKERILDVAFERFKHFGFLKTTVEEIAKQAQVGKGTIYFYFKNKEEILVALVDREFKTGFAIISEAMDQEQNKKEKLRKMLQMSFEHFYKNKLISKVMAMDPGLVLSVIAEKNKKYQIMSIAGIKSLLTQGQREGVFRKVDFDKVAYAIDSLIRSFHYLSYLNLEVYRPEEMLDPVFDLLFFGLENR